MRAHSYKRFVILIGVAAAGVMALGAQTAAAAVNYDTKVTITADRGMVNGDLKSEVRECEGRRRVVLFKRRPGADRRVGTDRSRHGSWSVWVHGGGTTGIDIGNRVWAKVKPKVRDRFVCRADRSSFSH